MPTVNAIYEKESSKFYIFEGLNVPVGISLTDNQEHKFSVVDNCLIERVYKNKKGEDVKCKVNVLTVVVKDTDSNSLLHYVKQEALNNSRIKIIAQGDVHIDGDVGSINAIQNLDLHTYWNYLKKDISDLFDSKSFKKDIQEIDDYFLVKKQFDS